MLADGPIAGVQVVDRLFDQVSTRLLDVEIPVGARAIMVQVRGCVSLCFDEQYVADCTVMNLSYRFTQLVHGPHLLSGLEHVLALFCSRHYTTDVGRGHADGLFTVDMLARFQCSYSHLRMQIRRRGDKDCLHIFTVDNLVPIRRGDRIEFGAAVGVAALSSRSGLMSHSATTRAFDCAITPVSR